MSPKYLLSILVSVLLAGSADAQYTGNSQTNTISGVTSNWVGNGTYTVGSNWLYDALIIQSNGILSNGYGTVGYFGSNNIAIVSGNGSVWNNAGTLTVGYRGAGNELIITNGGTLYDAYGVIGQTNGANNNVAIVTGSGSVWNNTGSLTVGYLGENNELIVTDGGVVSNGYGFIGPVGIVNSGLHIDGTDAVTVSGNGSVWRNSGDLSMGNTFEGNGVLTVSNGGAVFNVNGNLIGGSAFVSATSSIWSNSGDLSMNGFQLTITNGGAVYNSNSTVYAYMFDSGVISASTVYVTGTGSLWSLGGNLEIGLSPESSPASSVTIDNGGKLYTASATLAGGGPGSAISFVLVTGTGSVWSNSGPLIATDAQRSSGESLIVSSGGAVFCGSADMTQGINHGLLEKMTITGTNSLWSVAGALQMGASSMIISNAGFVVVSNLNVGYAFRVGGSLVIAGGTLTVDNFVVTTNGPVNFSSGVLNTQSTSIGNNLTFVVGDGFGLATLQLNGGIHSFANNLEVSSNAFLTGCGTINGNVTIDPGGTVLANCGGMLTFTGIVTNNGTMRAVNGSVLQAYGTVVNNGLINVIDGSAKFFGGLVNHGAVLTETNAQISSITRSGNSITVQIPSVTNVTYQLQITPTLKPTNWTSVGTSQGGTGGALSFTDSGGATNRPGRFYRIDITLP